MKALTTLLTACSLLLMAPLSGMAQDDSRYGDTPDQQLKCKEALSVYKSYKKQKNYDEAERWMNAYLTAWLNAREDEPADK